MVHYDAMKTLLVVATGKGLDLYRKSASLINGKTKAAQTIDISKYNATRAHEIRIRRAGPDMTRFVICMDRA